jgi:branched-subunit amino acid transport protein
MNDALYVIAASIGMLLVTLATRASFFMLPSRFQLPARVERALRYAPACALIGIITPGIFTTKGGALNLDFTNPRLWAVVIAALVFAKTRNMMAMMAVGMAVFTILRLTT